MIKKRLYVDLDGTLAVWNPTATYEDLYQKGYFANLEPQHNVLRAIKDLIRWKQAEYMVYSLSAYPVDSRFAVADKMHWLNKYLEELPLERRLFVPCGIEKAEFVAACNGGLNKNALLLDDYTANLLPWSKAGTGIKLLNGINHTRGTWKGVTAHKDATPDEIIAAIERATMEFPLARRKGTKPVMIIYEDVLLFPTCCVFYVNEQYETGDIINLFSKGLEEGRKQQADSRLMFAGEHVCQLTGGEVHYLDPDASFSM